MVKKLFSKIKILFLESFRKKNANFLRIISIEGSPEQKSTEIYYQVRGKSTVSRDTPKKLVDDLALLTGFSKRDSNLILNLFISEEITPRWKISHVTFSEHIDKLHVIDIEEKRTLHFSPDMLLECDSLLEYFDRNDLLLIFKLASSRMVKKDINVTHEKSNKPKDNLIYVVKK